MLLLCLDHALAIDDEVGVVQGHAGNGGRSENRQLDAALRQLLGRAPNSSCAMMAGATLAVLPLLILFVFLQRFLVDSIVGSAIKG